jgi:ABC-2 type transport system permease protein
MYGMLVGLLLAIDIGTKTLGSGEANNWEMMQITTVVLFTFVTIFTVVVSADSVAGEFTAGTIKLLLIRPWSRSKILLSKYISLILFAFLMSALLFVLSLAVNIMLFGYDGSADVVQRVFHSSRDMGPISYMLVYYLDEFISLVVTVTLSFMLSTVFRSGGLAIGLSLFLLLGGGTITGMLSMLDYEWVKYILFMHMNLTQYLQGQPMREGLTIGFSLSVLAAYYAVFVALTWLIFNKRDVAG